MLGHVREAGHQCGGEGVEGLQAGGLGLLNRLLLLLLGAAVQVQAPDRAGQPAPGCALCICQALHSASCISAMQLEGTGQVGMGMQVRGCSALTGMWCALSSSGGAQLGQALSVTLRGLPLALRPSPLSTAQRSRSPW